MRVPIHNKNPNIKLASQEKLEERETWHKLVVKVLVWKDRSSGKGLVEIFDKLTITEWKTYQQQIIKINTTQRKEKILTDLQNIWLKIKQNGGFEEEK